MNLRVPSRWALPVALAFVVPAAGCGGGGGGGSGRMAILECSLQCSDSSVNPGSQISCGRTNVFVNQEIRISFTAPVDPITVTSNSFQLVEVGTGKTPAGTFSLDPNDPKTLIFRPALTFDSAGNPIFGLTQDKAYFFKVPGAVLDPLGPYIQSTGGQPNATRLQCTLIASEGVLDAEPGRPRASITVDTVTAYDPSGNPSEFDIDVPAAQAENVYRASPVRIVFDEVMNPATLANPVTGQSSFIRAFVDADGDTTDRSDEVAMNGLFTVTIDQAAGQTTVVFQPSGGLPSAGSNPASPRKVVIELSPQIADLGGNPLLNPGTVAFTPEMILFQPFTFDESFEIGALQDPVRSAGEWGGGRLTVGIGGGSGRLGDLVVLPGSVVVLDTDFEDFSSITNPVIFTPSNVIDPPDPLVITDGIFEFARLRVDAGGTLRLKGVNPARIYVRGVADIQGLIDVSGVSGVLHRSSELQGGAGGPSGPGGGDGGRGGSRPDGSAFTGTFQGIPIGGVANPGVGPTDVTDPASYEFVNGIPGGGIPFPSTMDPSPTFVAGGQSGLGWPQPTAAHPELHMPQDVNDVMGMEVDRYQECRYPAPAAPGGGGANAFNGAIGDATYNPLSPVFLPPDTPGGIADDLLMTPGIRTLSPELGLLRGGGGGGGGGAHIQRTQVNGSLLFDCFVSQPTGSPLQVVKYLAHSSAGGGGGGGGLQVVAGNRIILNGIIDASGGVGGSGTFPPDPDTPEDLAQAGGGGAGGSVLLRSDRVQIQAVPGRINVAGGVGGEGSGSVFPILPSTGGRGAPGFVRIEATVPPLVQNEKGKITPDEATLQGIYGASVTSDDILSTAPWTPSTTLPSGFSGAQSCWVRPSGNFFRLIFAEDDTEPGWDMHLRIAGQANPQSFRGANDLFPGMTLEEAYGTDLGGAPVVVRFQGARAVRTLIDPCSVPEIGAASPLTPGSLTGWVSHPAELNDYFGDDSLTPNIFRFVVLWDQSQVDFPGIQDLEDLSIEIQPD